MHARMFLSNGNSMRYQKTLQQRTISDPVHLAGRSADGERAVSVSILPAVYNTGYVFARHDVYAHMRTLPAHWDSVLTTERGALLANKHGITLAGVEYMMAALRGCDIDNARIIVDGPDIPNPNSSALHFVEALRNTGSVVQSEPRYIYWVHNPIQLRQQDKYAVLSPDEESRITVHLDNYAHGIGTQVFSFRPGHEEFTREIAPARRLAKPQYKYAGESLAQSPADADNEFIRHLTLEIYGFLALMRHDFIGHLYIKNPSLTFLHEFVQHFFGSRKHWSYVSIKDYQTIAHSEIRYTQAKNSGRDS